MQRDLRGEFSRRSAAKPAAYHEREDDIATAGRIADEAREPAIAVIAALAGASAGLASNMPIGAGEHLLDRRRGPALDDGLECDDQPVSRGRRQEPVGAPGDLRQAGRQTRASDRHLLLAGCEDTAPFLVRGIDTQRERRHAVSAQFLENGRRKRCGAATRLPCPRRPSRSRTRSSRRRARALTAECTGPAHR